MALTAVTSIGRVDLPAGFTGLSLSTGGQLKLQATVVEFTVNVAGDYSAGNGFLYSTIVAAINAAAATVPPTVPVTSTLTDIVGAQVLGIRNGATSRNIISINNHASATPGVQAFIFAVTPTIAEYTVTASDIVRLLVIGL